MCQNKRILEQMNILLLVYSNQIQKLRSKSYTRKYTVNNLINEKTKKKKKKKKKTHTHRKNRHVEARKVGRNVFQPTHMIFKYVNVHLQLIFTAKLQWLEYL